MGREALLLLLGLTFTAYAQDPMVTIPETEPPIQYGVLQVERDTDTTMSCFVENKQEGTNVRWNKVFRDPKNEVKVLKVSEDTSVEDNTKYSIEKPTQFQWRLRIKNTQIGDEGNYTCFVYTTVDNRKEANITVLVGVVPYFDPEQTSSDMVVKQGDNVDLLCNATARPNPTIMWSRIGKALLPIGKEVHYESKLTILKIKPQDRGKYRCEAFNTIGRNTNIITRDITVDVRFAPLISPVHRVLEQAPGYQIELQCLAEANPYPLEGEGLAWMKNSIAITRSGSRYKVQALHGAFNRMMYEMIIYSVEESDYGRYECKIKNNEGISSQYIELRKTDVPQKSKKLNRVIKGGAAATAVAMTTLVSCLFILILQYL